MLEQHISRKLTYHARHSLKEAGDIALSCNTNIIEPRHLLFAIYMEKGSLGSMLLHKMEFSKEKIESICLKKKKGRALSEKQTSLSPELKEIITYAYYFASQFSYTYVGSEHLIYAIAKSNDAAIKSLFENTEIKSKEIQSLLRANINPTDMPNFAKMLNMPPENIPLKEKSRGNASTTPFLDQYGIDLTEEVRNNPDKITGRTQEITRMIQVLGRRGKNNPLLIGEPGVGKTTLVSALAKKILDGKAGNRLANKRIIALDLALVVAGTNFRGEFEARLKEILLETYENPDIILFIDEIHTIIGAGNTSGGLDAANIFKPALSRGDIQCIGATTFAEYKRHIEKDPAFERRFQPITLNEPTPEEAKHILEESKGDYEEFHNVILKPDAISAIVDFSVRYFPDRFLPDKAFDLLDETASALRQQAPTHPLTYAINELEFSRSEVEEKKHLLVQDEKFEEALKCQMEEKALEKKIEKLQAQLKKEEKKSAIPLTVTDAAKTVSRITRIPFSKILASKESKQILSLKKQLSSRIIGQNEVIEKLSQTLTRSFSGISNPDRPLGSFLFLGPSGVGKTLSAKILAETLFENKQALIRLDMSEFSERHSTAQIIGAPAGYVGYGEGGKLTEKVRRNPYSVILFDEIEKAHPDVFNILLQILDDGVLTDAEGRKVSFRNTIVILTSNIGTQSFTQSARIGFADNVPQAAIQSQFESIEKDVLNELKDRMRPELLNRLDHIIVFQPIAKKDIEKIVAIELQTLVSRLETQNIKLHIHKNVASFIAEKSFAVEQGARLIRKNIQNYIETALADHILTKKHSKSIDISMKNGTIAIK